MVATDNVVRDKMYGNRPRFGYRRRTFGYRRRGYGYRRRRW